MSTLQVRARNQLRVNGLTFNLYFGSFFVVLGGMLLVLLVLLLGLIFAFNFAALLIPPAFGERPFYILTDLLCKFRGRISIL